MGVIWGGALRFVTPHPSPSPNAELSVQIVARNEPISAWLIVMLEAYPIVETLYSIYRRTILLQTPSMQPDALHLHSMVYRRVTLRAEQDRPDSKCDRPNAGVAPQLWLHGLLYFTLALIFHDNTRALLVGLVGYVIVYVIHYQTLWKLWGAGPEEA
jgi:UDP-GlcNAc:undecaprenyl-phosphate GlcNAc-1-phosphate transferase